MPVRLFAPCCAWMPALLRPMSHWTWWMFFFVCGWPQTAYSGGQLCWLPGAPFSAVCTHAVSALRARDELLRAVGGVPDDLTAAALCCVESLVAQPMKVHPAPKSNRPCHRARVPRRRATPGWQFCARCTLLGVCRATPPPTAVPLQCTPATKQRYWHRPSSMCARCLQFLIVARPFVAYKVSSQAR